MSPAVLLTLIAHGSFAAKEPVSGAIFWEERPEVQRRAGVHPKLRFGCWDIIRFNKSTTYMMSTPTFIQQGQFEARDGNYSFKATMANDLENADIAKFMQEMSPDEAHDLKDKYTNAMCNFSAVYEKDGNCLLVTYPVEGRPKTFELYRVDDGDDALTPALSDEEQQIAGLWHAPEPFPDRLDARVRYKIGDIEGLRSFAKEAGASESAQLTVIDFRVDRHFRLHQTVGMWSRKGSTVKLMVGGEEIDYNLSADGTKLLRGGRPVYQRN